MLHLFWDTLYFFSVSFPGVDQEVDQEVVVVVLEEVVEGEEVEGLEEEEEGMEVVLGEVMVEVNLINLISQEKH